MANFKNSRFAGEHPPENHSQNVETFVLLFDKLHSLLTEEQKTEFNTFVAGLDLDEVNVHERPMSEVPNE